MSKRTTMTILCMSIIVMMMISASSLWAKSSRYCVNSRNTDIVFTGFDDQWFNGNVFHMRGVTGIGSVKGDIAGGLSFIQNIDYNFKTQKGHFTAKQYYDVTLNNGNGSLVGGFEGSLSLFLSGDIVYGEYEYDYVGHGTGDFEGMKFFQTCLGGDAGPETCEGFILDPHGTIDHDPCD